MVWVVEHSHRDDDVEVTEGVASSAPHASRVPAPGATVPVEQQPSAAARAARRQESGRPSRAPSQAASGGALAAARELLRNPPAEAASPDALKQWRDDVDRLLHLAQASPSSARTGQRPPPGNAVVPYRQRQGGASASVRSPTVRGARTEDLRAELNRRRAGEDARISVERARERRLNIEGRNLNADLDVVAPKPPVNARIQPGAPVAGVDYAALAEHLRAVAWPSKFRPTCRKNMTVPLTRRSSCRCTLPPSQQLVVTAPSRQATFM